MKRGQKTSAEQIVLKLRLIEVQTAQGKSLALACKEAEISEQVQGRVPEAGDLLQLEGGADRDRPLAEDLQPRPAALGPGLPAACACHLPGSGLPATHGQRHAIGSQSARSKMPVRSVASEVIVVSASAGIGASCAVAGSRPLMSPGTIGNKAASLPFRDCRRGRGAPSRSRNAADSSV